MKVRHKGPAPYLFLSPYLLLTSIFFIVPFVNAIVLAFYETNGPRSRAFVGLDNFRFLLHDTNFHTALKNTTIFALVSVCVQLPLAMGLALLLNGTRGLQFFTPLAITTLSVYLGFGATLSIGAFFSAAGAAMVWLLPETRGRSITALDGIS